MSNVYCTYAQLSNYYDVRTLTQLSADDDSGNLDQTLMESILDTAASELDSVLQNRYQQIVNGTTAPPLILTRWVAAKAMGMALLRRNKESASVQADVEWADKFANDLVSRKINLNMARTNAPATVMESSGEPTHGRFDDLRNFDRSIPGGKGNT
jgi:phage gp36-like protein